MEDAVPEHRFRKASIIERSLVTPSPLSLSAA